MNIEAEIVRIARTLSDRSAVYDAIAALPGAVAYPTGFVRCENLETFISRRTPEGEEHEQRFRWLRELDIAAAPELVKCPIGDYDVNVLRYWICPGERLIRVKDSNVKFTEHARGRFRSDMERLFDHGKMFPYIRGDAHWLVSETTGAILLWSWELIDAAPSKREEYFESIDRTFARHT